MEHIELNKIQYKKNPFMYNEDIILKSFQFVQQFNRDIEIKIPMHTDCFVTTLCVVNIGKMNNELFADVIVGYHINVKLTDFLKDLIGLKQ